MAVVRRFQGVALVSVLCLGFNAGVLAFDTVWLVARHRFHGYPGCTAEQSFDFTDPIPLLHAYRVCEVAPAIALLRALLLLLLRLRRTHGARGTADLRAGVGRRGATAAVATMRGRARRDTVGVGVGIGDSTDGAAGEEEAGHVYGGASDREQELGSSSIRGGDARDGVPPGWRRGSGDRGAGRYATAAAAGRGGEGGEEGLEDGSAVDTLQSTALSDSQAGGGAAGGDGQWAAAWGASAGHVGYGARYVGVLNDDDDDGLEGVMGDGYAGPDYHDMAPSYVDSVSGFEGAGVRQH